LSDSETGGRKLRRDPGIGEARMRSEKTQRKKKGGAGVFSGRDWGFGKKGPTVGWVGENVR